MEFSDMQVVVPIGAMIAIGTLVLTIQKITKNFKKEREEQAAKILQAAKEEDSLIKTKLEARLEKISLELRNLEFNINKDIDHIKDTHSNEIKNLGEKIEALRDELHDHHGQLVSLLTQMIKTPKD